MFSYADVADWGGKDFEDEMTSAWIQVTSMGIADPDKLAVMGWSYGGFMTSWVVTHTDRFQGRRGRRWRHQPLEFYRHFRHPGFSAGLLRGRTLGPVQ